jgi:hypothetical protein
LYIIHERRLYFNLQACNYEEISRSRRHQHNLMVVKSRVSHVKAKAKRCSPVKGQQPASKASPSTHRPPKTKGNSLRKSDSQLYSTAPTLLVAFNQFHQRHTYHFSLFPPTFESSTPTYTHSNHVVKPNARDHGDAPRVHQGRHSIHQPLHVCCILLFLASCCPFSYSAGLLCLRYKC